MADTTVLDSKVEELYDWMMERRTGTPMDAELLVDTFKAIRQELRWLKDRVGKLERQPWPSEGAVGAV